MSSEFFEGLAEAVTARRHVLPRRMFVNLCIGVAATYVLGAGPAIVWIAVMLSLHAAEWILFKSPDVAVRRPWMTLALYGLTCAAFCALTAPLAYQRGEVGRVGGAMMLTSMAYTFAVSSKASKPLYFAWLAGIAAGFIAMISGSALAHLPLTDLATLSVVSVICVVNSLSTWRESYKSTREERVARSKADAAVATERKAWQVAMMAEELAGVGHWRRERDAPAFHASQQVYRIFGLEPSEGPLPVEVAKSIDHPEDRERVNAAFMHAFETGETTDLSYRLLRRDGEVRHVACRGAAERDANGSICAIFGVIQDVTDQVRAAEALKHSEAQFRRMAENANDLITCTSAAGELLYVSPAMETITGYTPKEVLGGRALNLLHPDDFGLIAERMRLIRERPDQLLPPFECRIRAKDGRWVWLESRPSPIIDPVTGEYQGVTDVVRDITERKAMETALKAARLEAERAAKVKGEFLANMSHELRTPLTSIIGFSHLLRAEAQLSDVAQDHIDRVVSASEVLLATVNDILDFSKLEAGQVEIRTAPARVAEIASDIIDLFSLQAKTKGVELRLSCAEALSQPLMLDAVRVRQVLLNLVGNALKFTAQGHIALDASLSCCGTRLQVSVADTGRGVPADELGRLFQRFSQVDGSIARDHGGTGLGLAICKGLLEAMGGTIHVESEEGRGSRFWFETPALFVSASAEAGVAAETDIAGLEGARILVVDDHDANRALVRALLAPLGCQVETARGGAEAVTLADANRFDVILMDLRMPGVDGATACAAIRASRGPNASQPILAFTADASHGRAVEVVATGFDDHVAKPIMPADLLTRVAGWVGRRHTAENYAISA